MQTPGCSPIHYHLMREYSRKHKCPFCAKLTTDKPNRDKRMRNRKFTAEGLIEHIKGKHV